MLSETKFFFIKDNFLAAACNAITTTKNKKIKISHFRFQISIFENILFMFTYLP